MIYNSSIIAAKVVFVLITIGVLFVTASACLTDVLPDARRFWIAASIACVGVITAWRLKTRD
jgi:hypothetical protein